jgi:hypothetical protein
VPYPEVNLKSGIEMLKLRLMNGYILEKPEKCPDELYAVMRKCWILNREKRIKFSQLVTEMKSVLFELYEIKL